MESGPDPQAKAPTALEAEVAALERRALSARNELASVLADIAHAQAQLGSHQVQQLLEANEQLVVDAVRSRTMAESAAQRVNELTKSSELDGLTGLPNRVLLIDRFSQALTHAKRRDNRLALLFLDLDQFKQINDTLGHKIGDAVLRAVGRCLNGCVREADTVSRLGGDEFVLLLTEVASAADPGRVAEKLVASLAQLTMVDGVAVRGVGQHRHQRVPRRRAGHRAPGGLRRPGDVSSQARRRHLLPVLLDNRPAQRYGFVAQAI